MVLDHCHHGRPGFSSRALLSNRGDAVLLPDTTGGLKVVSDERVNQLAGKEREAANRVPAGSALKLRRRAQLTRTLRRARNQPGGYGVAATGPQAARPSPARFPARRSVAPCC